MSSDMLLRSSSCVDVPHGTEAGEAGVRRVCPQPPSKQPRELLPNMYSHPDKWKELSIGRERQDRPRAGRVVGIGAVTITHLTSGLLKMAPGSKIFGAGWHEQVHILRNSSIRLAKMSLPCFSQWMVLLT